MSEIEVFSDLPERLDLVVALFCVVTSKTRGIMGNFDEKGGNLLNFTFYFYNGIVINSYTNTSERTAEFHKFTFAPHFHSTANSKSNS